MVNNLISIIGNNDGLKFKALNKKIINSRLDLLDKSDIELKIADARDYHIVSRLITDLKPDMIVHLAQFLMLIGLIKILLTPSIIVLELLKMYWMPQEEN